MVCLVYLVYRIKYKIDNWEEFLRLVFIFVFEWYRIKLGIIIISDLGSKE